ncbi:CD48 antigen-like [Talpa occidentalis]|uniref:CD48 antigen-like n=1 Tax=Talpa occidentalis TaxID=50954 RepID=UPI00188E46C0|nr:CD48 antigen-like [Talpa occidentalis]
MGPCPEDPQLCRVSWALGLASLLLSSCSPGAQSSAVKDPGAYLPLKGIRGGSVLFHLSKFRAAELEQTEWGVGPESDFRVFLRVHRGKEDAPTWVSLRDKYEQRVHVPSMASLRMENLTREDSGRYWARAQLTGGRGSAQGFQLTVYEPVPLPQILIESLSIAPGWCNVTLECRTPGDGENLSVTWESQGLLGGLERRTPSGPAPSSWTLAVKLPLSQPHANLTCVVSNPADQKTHTKALGDVCAPVREAGSQGSSASLRCIIRAVLVVLLLLGSGLCLWKTHWNTEKMEPATSE